MQFKKATKSQARLRLALIGASGAGKTFTALEIAKGIAPTGKIALIDTEHGSASKYADRFDFDSLSLERFSPDDYIQAIKLAVQHKFDVLIIDSLSHAWAGKGGILEMVDSASSGGKGNSFTNWGKVTPKHNQLIEAILGAPMHIIATMRAKTDYVIENINGKQIPRKIGQAPVQRDGMEYEFDVVAMMDDTNTLSVTKTRYSAIQGSVIERPDSSFGVQLAEWLSDGEKMPEPQALPEYDHNSVSDQDLFSESKLERLMSIGNKLFNLSGELLEARMREAASKILKQDVADLCSLHWKDGGEIMRQLEEQATKRGLLVLERV